MLKKQILGFIILYGVLNIANHVHAQVNVDSIFVHWNEATFGSLKRQKLVHEGTEFKDVYDNRLRALNLRLEVDSCTRINHASLRYIFLNMLFAKYENIGPTFFVVEADKPGYTVTLRNFVFWIDTTKIVRIKSYNYINDNWRKVGETRLNDFHEMDHLKTYFTMFNKGFNKDDVTISVFMGNKIVESEYYLYSTLSISSGIKRIFDTDKKEN